jgi:hypothetical protein
MGAGKFYAAHAARAKADPVGHALNLATLKHERHVSDLKAEHVAAIAELQLELTATQTALRQAQTGNDKLRRQFEISNAACRQELATVQAALSNSQADNERMRRRLKQCDAVNKLIAAATQEDNDHP